MHRYDENIAEVLSRLLDPFPTSSGVSTGTADLPSILVSINKFNTIEIVGLAAYL